jgi:hypothetical protein
MKTRIEQELRRRADFYLPQTHLMADYYRIRRKVAFPLPSRSMHLPAMGLSGAYDPKDYPWSIWMIWALEDRIGALGWTGHWQNDAKTRQVAERDLDGLADWPRYRQLEKPDLCMGHTGRTLWAAYMQWNWLSGPLRKKIETALARLLSDGLPYSEKMYSAYKTRADILGAPHPHMVMHNIPFIGTIAMALAADVVKHPSLPMLNQRLDLLFSVMLDMRADGFTEGVAYDGYVLDFVLDWMAILPAEQRERYLRHPHFKSFFTESYALAAPGNAIQVAEIADVEPERMPFHLSAHAKTHKMQPDPLKAWHLQRCDFFLLRPDALAALHSSAETAAVAPAAGAHDAAYALVLRSGWEKQDMAVAISACGCPMGHMHFDNGSVVIGTAGKWQLADPGYQQYLAKKEREFTLGAQAHNAPVINGKAQTIKAPRRLALSHDGARGYAALDLAACYEDPALQSVARHVWQFKNLVVIADRIRATPLSSLAYNWHGHPDAGWWVEDNWTRLYTPEATLWFTSPQAVLDESKVDRLSGSRGQLTLSTQADTSADIVWWVFGFGDAKPVVKSSGAQLTVDGQQFSVPQA